LFLLVVPLGQIIASSIFRFSTPLRQNEFIARSEAPHNEDPHPPWVGVGPIVTYHKATPIVASPSELAASDTHGKRDVADRRRSARDGSALFSEKLQFACLRL